MRAGIRHLLNTREWDLAARCVWSLFAFWWLDGHAEVRTWMEELLDSDEPIEPRSRAIALYFRGTIGYWQGTDVVDVQGLVEGAALFRESGDRTGEAFTLSAIAFSLPTTSGLERAEELLATATALVREAGDGWGRRSCASARPGSPSPRAVRTRTRADRASRRRRRAPRRFVLPRDHPVLPGVGEADTGGCRIRR